MNNIKILYLEDLPTDVELVKRELTKNNIDYEIRVVENRNDFTKSLIEFTPDIVLSDHSLPDLNSLDALKLAKKNNSFIPVILITSTIPEEYAIEIMKEGASDYILKDRMQRLPAAILNAIETKRIERERQKYLDEVIESEALMKEIEYLANVGSWESNFKNGTTKWSDEIYLILGVKPGEFEASFENYFNFLYSDDRIIIEKTIKNAIENLNAIELNYKIVDKNNNEKFIWSEFMIDRDENNKPVLVTGFIQDVSERKQNEQSLKESELRFREFFEYAPEANLIINIDTELIIDFNRSALKLFKYNREDFLNINLEKLSSSFNHIGNDEEKKSWGEIAGTIESGDNHLECTCIDAKGDTIYCEVRFAKLNNSKGNLIRASFIDITKRKVAEFERDMITSNLIQRNKELEQLNDMISHKLCKPVSNIKDIIKKLKGLNINSGSKETLEKLFISVKNLDVVMLELNNLIKVQNPP